MENTSLPLLSINWDTTDPLPVFQEFQALSEYWLKDQGTSRRDQYRKIAYLLDPKGIEVWKSFT